MMTAVDLIWVADLAATGIFAVTGALVASRKRMDIFGFVWFAALTGVGGGHCGTCVWGCLCFGLKRRCH